MIRQPAGADAGGSIGEVKIAIQDVGGNIVSSADDTITLSLDHNPTAAVLGGITSAPAVKGVASFSSLSLTRPGSGYTLRASAGATGPAPVSSTPFDIASQLAPPQITPPAGDYSGPVWMRLSSPVPGAVIHFTTDGKTPDPTSPVFTAPFQVTASTEVKSIAVGEGLTPSGVTSADIQISGGKPYGIGTRLPLTGLNLPAAVEALPHTLSETGLFRDTAQLTPQAGLVPYALNHPAWTDKAESRHWLALPESAQIGFAPTGEYIWPGGSVFVQHLEMVMNETTGERRRLETRLLVLDASVSTGYGATYRWRADGREADLVDPAGQDETLKITEASGAIREQTWNYPAQGMCFLCHNPNAGFVLGPKTRQLNGEFTYAEGLSDNQLRTWNYLQMFRPTLREQDLPAYPRSVRLSDAEAPLETRVRSYLDANCAPCHRPGGTGALWDARLDTPLASQNILNGELRDTMGIENAKIVSPGDPAKSMMRLRLSSTTLGRQMPPFTRNLVDAAALKALDQWIRESVPSPAANNRSR